MRAASYLLLSFCIAAPGSRLGAQLELPPITLNAERIGTDEGLPQGMVPAMLQDRSGYLWFGTKDGLARYDGYGFQVFRRREGDSTSVCGNYISALLEDEQGRIWVGTENKGICRYDPATGLFQRIPTHSSLRQDLRGIQGLALDGQGNLWVQVRFGAERIFVVPGDDPNTAVRPVHAFEPELQLVQGAGSVLAASDGSVWLASTDSVQCILWSEQGAARSLKWSGIGGGFAADPEMACKLLADTVRGHVLVASPEHILRFSSATHQPVDTLSLLPGIELQAECLDREGFLWFGGIGNDHERYDLASHRMERVVIDWPQLRSWVPAHFTLGLEDRSGNLWLRSAGHGVGKISRSKARFRSTPLIPPSYSFHRPADREGKWFFRSWPFALLDGEGRELPVDWPKVDTTSFVFQQAMIDPKGRILVGVNIAHGQDLWLRDKDEQWSKVRSLEPEEGLAGLFPGLGSEAWLPASSTAGPSVDRLIRLDLTSGAITRFPLPEALPVADYASVGALEVLPDSTVWLATVPGLLSLDMGPGAWATYKWVAGDSTSLPNGVVLTLCQDPVDPLRYLWVGTDGGGLSRLDRRDGTFRRYTEKHGLPNMVVNAILADDRGKLWFSTNQGLCWFDPSNGATRTYTTEDGLHANEFDRHLASRTRDGRLRFGGAQHLLEFDPADFYAAATPSPTVLTGVRLMNRPWRPEGIPEDGSWSVEHAAELVFPHDARMITFTFACLDHTSPQQNRFRFRMEGAMSGWIENNTANEATFTNLDPGRYSFQVQGRNSAGAWDPVGASIALVITPPWWGTWWFRTLMVLAFAGLLYAFYRYRLARAMEVVRVRDRIARDLHDEIGSTLSSVALYSTVARNKAGDRAPEASAMLDRITESTTEVMEAMNDIVWAVNARNDDMAHVVQRMRSFGVAITEAAGMKLVLEVAPGMEALSLDMQQRRDLYLMFKEAVNNAVKYSGGSTVRVSLQKDGGQVLMKVVDDGHGFDPDGTAEVQGPGGNGLPNMRRRAGEMGGVLVISSTAAGTRVELRFDPHQRKSLDPTRTGAEGRT